MTDYYPPFPCEVPGCTEHTCIGIGWSGLRGKRGRWYCWEHWKELEARQAREAEERGSRSAPEALPKQKRLEGL
ncbi:hypothetical protein [Rhodoligotrophos defluvii]|uniref:hypothetical protein n=1 Tax=Rhodoligotrophos defluvii TaxID=2561934 RepID=UPI0010CA0F73|nr:hypothetical protein [Rhodoligotrophos defluvii]